jgi:hypothetical protein
MVGVIGATSWAADRDRLPLFDNPEIILAVLEDNTEPGPLVLVKAVLEYL